jgi:hypothetical protein
MNFLINLFKSANKGDNFRAAAEPIKYNDGIAQLNSVGDSQYDRMSTDKIKKIGRINSALTPETSGTTKVPGK